MNIVDMMKQTTAKIIIFLTACSVPLFIPVFNFDSICFNPIIAHINARIKQITANANINQNIGDLAANARSENPVMPCIF